MCGFVGVINDQGIDKNILKNMTASLGHRGPNNNGYWIDNEHKVAFGHARLAVMDVSMAGNQPMVSKNGRYVIVFGFK